MRTHSAPLFPESVWNREWAVQGQPFIPMIKSIRQPLDLNAGKGKCLSASHNSNSNPTFGAPPRYCAELLTPATINSSSFRCSFTNPVRCLRRGDSGCTGKSGGDVRFAAYPENHRFQVPLEAHWRKVRQSARNVGQALQSAMRTIETANPDKLYGIFGDAQWTNKDRLADAMLRDLVEHFSSLELTLANLPEDELGQGYEYLIKKFADDSGHTAAEFYTNRTVVHLMTEMLEPQPGESYLRPNLWLRRHASLLYHPYTPKGPGVAQCPALRPGTEPHDILPLPG